MRRIMAGSALLVTGLVSSWELLQNLSPNANGSANSSTAALPPPPTTETVSQTVTEAETVTVTEKTVTATEYVSGSPTQKSATSSQTSQQSSQQTSQQSSTTQQSSQSASTTSSTSSTSSSTSTPPPVPAGYVLVAAMSSLAGKSSAYFNHPSKGLSLLLNQGGQWNAFSATCTHAPCTVKYTGTAIYCPCHDGYYNPNNGAVTGGPPPRALHQFGVLIQSGNLYVTAT